MSAGERTGREQLREAVQNSAVRELPDVQRMESCAKCRRARLNVGGTAGICPFSSHI